MNTAMAHFGGLPVAFIGMTLKGTPGIVAQLDDAVDTVASGHDPGSPGLGKPRIRRADAATSCPY